MKKALYVLGLLALGFAACTSSGEVGNFQLLMKDLPIDMDHVWVTFAELTLFSEGEPPVTIETKDDEGNPLRVDLLELREIEGEKAKLGTIFSGSVPAGTYTQIRLILTKAAYVAFGDDTDTEIDLFVPSGEIKIPVEFTIEEGDDLTTVTIDFDAESSVHVHPTGNGLYIMRPVVTLVSVVTE
ncbi:MAG: DUF4382 domain-containing protein [Candidatus Aminicenantes bacterium]|nr:DUF4382 domain-containing protein [Candidatus Aminicenantes bacterium]